MNLIYCTSPLQVLIAERIIDLYPNEQFYCVFDGDPKQTKQWYYYERLKARCQDGVFIHRKFYSNPLKAYLDAIRILLIAARLPKVQRTFIASTESSIFRMLMSSMRSAEVYTYDDGSINLSPNAFEAMHNVEDGGFIQMLRKVFYIPSVKELEARSLRHYTIYQYPNVMPRCEYISLTKDNKGESITSQPLQPEQSHPEESRTNRNVEKQSDRVMSIFLGQRVYSYDNVHEDVALTEHIISTYGIGYYLPHPKESYTIKGVEYIQTPLIAEDYILQILEENPDLEVRLYSYCSTALLNLSATPRVRVQGFRPKRYLDFLEETFDLYKELGIPIVDLDWEPENTER